MDRDFIIPPEFATIATICVATEGTIGGRKYLTVDGRALHAGLRVGKDFSTWIKGRINKYEFREGADFQVIEIIDPQNGGTIESMAYEGARVPIDYRLTTDMAKELAMIENNEMGRLARRYFI